MIEVILAVGAALAVYYVASRSGAGGGPSISPRNPPAPDQPVGVPPTLRIPAVTQNAVAPPPGIYREFRQRIDDFVDALNGAAAGLRVQVNYWWRPVGAGSTLPGSQHYAGLAVDVQGLDQRLFAERCRRAGLVVVVEDDQGRPYSHAHVQSRPAGLLPSLGYSDDQLRMLAR